MRTVICLFVALLNIAFAGIAFAGVFAAASLSAKVPATFYVAQVPLAVLATAAAALLVLARLGRQPSWGTAAMRIVCLGVPSVCLLGSLDYGILSDLELLLLLVVTALYLATWYAYRKASVSAS